MNPVGLATLGPKPIEPQCCRLCSKDAFVRAKGYICPERAPKLQNKCFLLTIHLFLKKVTATYVQFHQPKKVT